MGLTSVLQERSRKCWQSKKDHGSVGKVELAFTDAEVVCAGERFPVHRSQLCTGKSYMLNHLTGTCFDTSGGRCTDGVCLSVREFQ